MSGHMFFFVAILFCVGKIDALSSEDKESMKAALHPFVMQCAEEFGIPEEQFEETKKKGAAGKIDPCFMSCVFKKGGFFDSKGMFDVEKSAAFNKANLKSEEAIEKFAKIGSDCAKVNDEEVSDGEEGCERAKLLFDCIVEHKKDNDFDD